MPIDTIKVMMEADARGIESTLHRALDVVTGTVEKMNSEEVDWTSIMTRSVTPAIITGVASMFAFAISQSLMFDQSMKDTGESVGMTSGQIGTMSKNAENMAANTGQSAEDIASAMAKASTAFSDTGAQTEFVNDATMLAASGFGNLSDIVAAAMPIMQAFGVQTADQVKTVFTELMHAAQGSGESLTDFASQFSQYSSTLIEGGAKIGDLNNLFAAFGAEVAKLPLPEAQASFGAFTMALSGTNPALNALVGSSQSLLDTLRTKGGITAMADMGDRMLATGKSALVLAAGFHMTADEVAGLESTAKRLDEIKPQEDKIKESTESIATAFDNTDTSIRRFQKAWQETKIIAIDAIDAIIGSFATGIGELNKGWSGFFDDFKSGIGTLMDTSARNIAMAESDKSVATAINSKMTQLAPGISQGALSDLDRKTTNENMLPQLLHALSSKDSTSYSSNQQFFQNFNLQLGKGQTSLTGKEIAAQLYKMFQGTSQ